MGGVRHAIRKAPNTVGSESQERFDFATHTRFDGALLKDAFAFAGRKLDEFKEQEAHIILHDCIWSERTIMQFYYEKQ